MGLYYICYEHHSVVDTYLSVVPQNEIMKDITEPLSKHTTLRIGGEARILIPESKKELISSVNNLNRRGEEFKILGAGSNVLVTDQRKIDFTVIKTAHCCNHLSIDGNNVTAGASVMMPKLAHFLVQNGLGGIEFLYSVPGNVGGGIFMNAGRGIGYNKVISYYLRSVEIYDGEQKRTIPKEELTFRNRYSTFHEQDDWVILSASFRFPSQSPEIGEQLLKERIEKVSNNERTLPNAGSTFLNTEELLTIPVIRHMMSFIFQKAIKRGDVHYAHQNRFVNIQDASFKDMIEAINMVKAFHRLVPFIDEPELEWEIWK